MKINVCFTHVMEDERNPSIGTAVLDTDKNASLIKLLKTEAPELTEKQVNCLYDAPDVKLPGRVDLFVIVWTA